MDQPTNQAPTAEDLAMPTRGGCFVRLPDGSLAVDEQAHPKPEQQDAPADNTQPE